MRFSVVLVVALMGCATTAQTEQCYPSASWATPIFRCGMAAAPKPPEPKAEPKVEATPEPESTPKPEPKAEPEPQPELDMSSKVEIKGQSIELKEKLSFEKGSDVLEDDSKAVLDEVAKTLKDHPEIKKARIAGNTDSAGTKKLGDKRAKMVKVYLMSKGVAAKRLGRVDIKSEAKTETKPKKTKKKKGAKAESDSAF